MTTAITTASRFDQHSPIGIGTSAAAAVVVGWLCTKVGAQPEITGTLVAGAGALPAAIEYSLRGKRRNVTADIARLRRGELRRPTGLVVAMLAAALLLADSLIGGVFGAATVNLSSGTAHLLGWSETLIVAVAGFFISSYASHYLGKRPYLWTAVAVGAVFVLRMLIILTVFGVDPALALLVALVGGYLILLAVCEAGSWYGRRHHGKFLTKKLARIEHKASRAAADKEQSTAPDPTSGTDLLAPNNAAGQQPARAAGPDPLEQLQKLAGLRDEGVLTDDEFKDKKAEILARI